MYERTEQTICKGILSRLFFLLLVGVQKEKQVKEHSSAIYNFRFFSRIVSTNGSILPDDFET
jgi:hypothetical protein